MPPPTRILFLTYPGAALLDFAGPSGAFAVANELLAPATAYHIECLSTQGGPITLNTGLTIHTRAAADIDFQPSDTLLVIGAPQGALLTAEQDTGLQQALRAAAKVCQRYGSVCTGAFLLAGAGLTDGRQSCTHWDSQRAFQRHYPSALLDVDALFTVDKNLWMSAGVTTGIDMALAMIEADQGRILKSKVAKHLLVYAQRSGHQSQFSDILLTQTRTDSRYAALIDWLDERLEKPIKVDDMADFMNMSLRSFHRHFIRIFGQSPSQFLTHMRLDRAQQLLESGEAIYLVATRVGFKSISAFRTAFKDYVGMTPSQFASRST